jgi:hydroxylamine dehydrogenase
MLQGENFLKLGILVFIITVLLPVTSKAFYVDPKEYGSPKGDICVQCHKETSPGIYNQWMQSAMGQAGVNCYDCHKAEKDDVDAFEHKEMIAIVVSPKDCSRCHEQEFKEFESSKHASAWDRLKTPDDFLMKTAWGNKNDRKGCIPCHGSVLKVEKEGKLSPDSWPNTGIGRVNPDGSKGSCTACHTRHIFSIEQARRPDSCSKCHTGDQTGQIDVYYGSKHGIMYKAFRDRMNMDRRRWLPGQDYFQGPTCVSCHLGAIPPQMEILNADQRIEQALRDVLKSDAKEFKVLMPPTKAKERYYGATHDVGSRLSWELKSTVPKKNENWKEKREMMQTVCKQCHGDHFIEQFYMQFDDIVEKYNKRFALPARDIRQALIEDEKLSERNYDDKLDIIYWNLLDKDGRKARYGAAMMNPDYVWGKGMEELTVRFHSEFLPEARRLMGRKADEILRKHDYDEPELKK